MISKELKEKWLTALKSGEYKQCDTYLSDLEGGNCCLGVLVDIHPELSIHRDGVNITDNGGDKYGGYSPLNELLGKSIVGMLWRENDYSFDPDKPDYSNVIPLIEQLETE